MSVCDTFNEIPCVYVCVCGGGGALLGAGDYRAECV